MRKILLLMAVLLPLSLFGMNDENEKVVMKIPLELDLEEKLNRLLIPKTGGYSVIFSIDVNFVTACNFAKSSCPIIKVVYVAKN